MLVRRDIYWGVVEAKSLEKHNIDPRLDHMALQLPMSLFKELGKESLRTGIPKKWIVKLALDNELETVKSCRSLFEVCETSPPLPAPIDWQSTANKIVSFLKLFPLGLCRIQLFILRKSYGVTNRSSFFYAYHELLRQGVVREVVDKDYKALTRLILR